jgi:comEA protein
MWGLTPDEKKVIIFFALTLALGNGVLLYKRINRSFAPELKYCNLELPKDKAPSDSILGGTSSCHLSQKPKDNNAKISFGKVNINMAGQSQLERLPKIGPTMAKRIIKYRQYSGKFNRIEDIMKVRGIGKKKFNQLREYIAIDH